MDKYDQLEKLANLKEQGILSEEEFQREKGKLFNVKNSVKSSEPIISENNQNVSNSNHIQNKRISPNALIVIVVVLFVSIGFYYFAYTIYKNYKIASKNTNELIEIIQEQKEDIKTTLKSGMVNIPEKDFKMDVTEITVAQFKECVNAGKCSKRNFGTNFDDDSYNYGKTGKENHPMNALNWYGANEYCKWVGKRLPTEEEWEYAAKGGEIFKYAGSDDASEIAWYDKNSENSTHEVATKKANGYGLYDMSGNVWEWTNSWYYSSNKYHVLKGGCFYMGVDDFTLDCRDNFSITDINFVSRGIGFRCIQTKESNNKDERIKTTSKTVMVKIPYKDFRIDVTEVTVAQFEECVKSGTCSKKIFGTNSDDEYTKNNYGTSKKNHPMNGVNWYGANEYCKWVGKRLPTEEEWEYAANGGQNYEYAGSDNPNEVAWYDKNSDYSTHEVATKKANGYGLYDMSGNVWEWTNSWYDSSNSQRVLRGGEFSDKNVQILLDSHHADFADNVSDGYGFRCVQTE